MTTLSAISNSVLNALNSYTVAINVTNTNVANSEMEGYTRQKAVLQTTDDGVDVTTIKRIYSSFLTTRLHLAIQNLGTLDAKQESLASVEVVFNESEASGLSSALSDFWNSWADLVNDPSDFSARSILASHADTLATTLNTMSFDLSDVQDSLDDAVADTVSSINHLVTQIAAVNQNVAQSEAAGLDSNAYKDSLNSLVTDLSALIGITTYCDDTGQISISLENGKPLVEGTTIWSLSTATQSTAGLQNVTWVAEGGAETIINDDISAGKLGGYLEVRDIMISSCQAELDTLAATIISRVNALHTTGFNLSGETGISFFTGSSASDIAVNTDILNDAGKIAASATQDGIPDDGTTASAIIDLQDALLLNGGKSTLSDYYAALVSKVGSTVSSAATEYEAQTSVVTACQTQRDSISAVSLDEELVNLTLYQNAYEAAAKIMTTLDEMMQTVINM